MRNLLVFAVFLPAPLLALNNGITIHDTSGAGQVKRPFSISRVFACGEFPAGAYPQPHLAGGTAIAPYQADVLTTCDDGSVRHAIVSFTADIPPAGRITVDFIRAKSRTSAWAQPPRADDQAAMLAFHGGAWGGKIQATAAGAGGRIVGAASARAMLAAGFWRYWLNGPVVRQIIIEDRFDADGGPTGAFSFDFGFQCDSSTGAACPPVLSGSPPTYASTVWKAAADDAHKSLHPIFVAAFYTGWSGVKTEYILENAWFGKLQDQQFDLDLFSGQMENVPVYSRPNTVFSAFRRMRETFWDGIAPAGWVNTDGDAGQIGVAIDYNLKYLEYSKAVPFYNPYVPAVPDNPVINYEIAEAATSHAAGSQTQWCGDGASATMCANWNTNQGVGGNQGSMAAIPRQYVRYLGSFSALAYRNMIDNGQAAAVLPIHIRESTVGKKFITAQPADAFGRVISIDARPGFVSHMGSFGQSQPADRLDPGHGTLKDGSIACVANSGDNLWCSAFDAKLKFMPWALNYSHFALFSYVPFLITGDWYFLENQEFAAAYFLGYGAVTDAGVSRPGKDTPPTCYNGRRALTPNAAGGTPDSDYGIALTCDSSRAEAWSIDNLAHAWFMSPTGSPEKVYFQEKVDRVLGVMEGRLDIRNGNYFAAPNPDIRTDPCDASTYRVYMSTPWCFGRYTVFGNRPNPLSLLTWMGSSASEGLNASMLNRADSPWWYAYYTVSIHRLEELGYAQAKPARQAIARSAVSQVMDSSVVGPDGKWLGPVPHAEYREMVQNLKGDPPQSWTELQSAVRTTTTLLHDVGAADGSFQIPLACTNSIYGGSDSIYIDGGQYLMLDRGLPSQEIVLTGCACVSGSTSTVNVKMSNCAGSRGVLGTSPSAHSAGAAVERLFYSAPTAFYTSKESGQYNQSTGAMSAAYDVSVPDSITGALHTGLEAYDAMVAAQKYREWNGDTTCRSVTTNPSRNCMNLMWDILPPHTIRNIVAAPGEIRWTAPDASACRIGLSRTEFSSSDDSGDVEVSGDTAERSYSTDSVGSQYFYRITCGPGGGTARSAGVSPAIPRTAPGRR